MRRRAAERAARAPIQLTTNGLTARRERGDSVRWLAYRLSDDALVM
jgi:hypothetical protein